MYRNSSLAGYAIDGRLATALGTTVVFGIGAAYGLLSSAVVLALPDVRAVRWRDRSREGTPGRAGQGLAGLALPGR